MSNLPRKPSPAQHNPLQVPVSSVGNGFVAILPNTPEHLIASESLAKSLKIVHLSHIQTDWLNDFLNSNSLTGEHAPHGIVVVTHEGGLFQARATLRFAPVLECARCLESFRTPIEVSARAIFASKSRFTNPVQNSQKSAKHSGNQDWDDESPGLHPDDLDLYEYSGLAFSLDEFFLDSMQTAIPDVIPCSENCPGLCSVCGSLNTENHKCR